MKKYEKIRYVSEFPEMLDLTDLISEVKYDGSNGRLTVENGELIFGTRNLEGESVSDKHYLAYYSILKDKIDKLDDKDKFEVLSLLRLYVLFFEMIGNDNLHKLRYGVDKDIIVFDGWDKSDGIYVPTDHVAIDKICKLLGLRKAERLEFKTYNQGKEWLYLQDGNKIEGIVFKYYPLQLYCKVLHPENSEVESAIFKKSKKKSQGNNYTDSLFLHTYVTKNRVNKIMFNLKATSMKDTSEILKELWLDLIMECLAPFVIKYHRDNELIDLGYIKKNYPKIAVQFIKEIIQDGVNWQK